LSVELFRLILKQYCFSATRFSVEYPKSVSVSKPTLSSKSISGTIRPKYQEQTTRIQTIAIPYKIFNPLQAPG